MGVWREKRFYRFKLLGQFGTNLYLFFITLLDRVKSSASIEINI